MNTIQIPQILDSETLLEYISKLIAQYKEQHTTAAGQEPTAGRESAPPATERRQAAAAAAARREPAVAYAGKELTTAVTRHQPPSYAEVVSNSGTGEPAISPEGKKRQPNRATEGDRERERESWLLQPQPSPCRASAGRRRQ
ncbi:hypothetical protein SASPL_140997 [Salvia splendens]|uniref:Uncharacterized protein n=1 Tax=Salvia splendens TaxID=180675 RepID=A0A8X8WRF1_SALSN|nr:hypothetical protein SASPL_140997 [Salvia splendens]